MDRITKINANLYQNGLILEIGWAGAVEIGSKPPCPISNWLIMQIGRAHV